MLKGRFTTPAIQHVPIELTCCVCDFSDGRELTALAGPIREACIPPVRKRDLYGMVEELLYPRQE